MSKDRPTSTTVDVESVITTDRDVDTLTAEEERLLRMRQGRPLAPEAPLGRKAAANTEAAAQLARIEAMLLQEARERRAAEAARPQTDARTKSKIVRALRRKG